MNLSRLLKGLILEMRPWQWYKQSMVFLALIFAGMLGEFSALVQVLMTALSFSLVAGSNYIINDILDREEDRKHPEKKERPIASGLVSVKLGAITSAVIFLAGFYIAYQVNILVFLIILFYLAQNLLYSFYLKEVIFLDVILISIGFVLRAIAGAAAIEVRISPWLIICTLLSALLLAVGKRKNEINFSAEETRTVLNEYTESVLNQMLVMVASALIISYSLYTFFGPNKTLMITLPFSYYAIFRYWFLVEKGYGGDPSNVLKDRGFAINLIIWSMIIIAVIYLDLGLAVEVFRNQLQV